MSMYFIFGVHSPVATTSVNWEPTKVYRLGDDHNEITLKNLFSYIFKCYWRSVRCFPWLRDSHSNILRKVLLQKIFCLCNFYLSVTKRFTSYAQFPVRRKILYYLPPKKKEMFRRNLSISPSRRSVFLSHEQWQYTGNSYRRISQVKKKLLAFIRDNFHGHFLPFFSSLQQIV